MSKNPYEILGVSQTATDEEIKDAYHTLAKKYHPDKYIDEGLKEMATSKMQQINEAYDAIKNMRENGSTSSGSYSTDTGSGSATANYTAIRNMINMGNFSMAENMLNAIPTSQHGAEWNFLKGCILLRRGWYHDATMYFDTACRLDPNNQEYRNGRLQVEKMSQGYATRGGSECGSGSDATACNCCCDLICLDSCCECCGGDLIPCC